MKFIGSILFLVVSVFLAVECLPRGPRDEPEPEIVFMPLETRGTLRDRQSGEVFLEEEDEPTVILPFGFSFPVPSVFRQFDNFFKHMADSLRGFAEHPSQWGNITNTTSTQKVVNGYVVTMNETTYSNGNNNPASLFHIKVVDVQPSLSPIEATSQKLDSTDVEEVRDVPQDKREHTDKSNEIPNEKSAEVAETFDNNNSETAELLETREFHSSETFNDVDNAIDVFETKPIDLSRDIYVNKLKDNKGGIHMIPSDVEVFDVADGKAVFPYLPYPPSTFRERTQKIVT